MIDKQFIQDGGIPLEKMTEREDRLVEGALEKIWKSGQFEEESEERNATLMLFFTPLAPIRP